MPKNRVILMASWCEQGSFQTSISSLKARSEFLVNVTRGEVPQRWMAECHVSY